MVFELLLSPFGRMKRLNYVMLSSLFGAMNVGLLILLGLRSGSDVLQVLADGPLSVFHASPVLSLTVVAGMWIQLCFVFKRSRDFSGSATWGWIFLILWAAPFVGPDLMDAPRSAGTRMMWQAICAIPAGFVGLLLLLRDSQPSLESLALISTQRRAEEEGIDLGDLSEVTDLVARARELPVLDAPAMNTPDPVVNMSPAKPASTGFGKRRNSALSATR